jgi:uncharacterized protein (DUF433 family)
MSVCSPLRYKDLSDASANFPSNCPERRGARVLCQRAVPALALVPSQKEAQLVTELERITQNPKVMGGKPCIRGMRVTVGMIVGQIGAGRSIEEILGDYPYLEREDILQALRYAAWRAEEREIAFA